VEDRDHEVKQALPETVAHAPDVVVWKVWLDTGTSLMILATTISSQSWAP